MDSGTVVNFLVVLFFVLLGGVFAGTEMALVSLRESQVRGIEKAGKDGARIAALARNPNRFLSTVQIGVTLSGFFSAAYGASTIAPDVEPLLENAGLGPAAEPVSFIGMTLLVAYLSLVLGELVRDLHRRHNEYRNGPRHDQGRALLALSRDGPEP